ncbi:MAG: hypothetical protein R8K21_04895 [Mariprofundales bacterium]
MTNQPTTLPQPVTILSDPIYKQVCKYVNNSLFSVIRLNGANNCLVGGAA